MVGLQNGKLNNRLGYNLFKIYPSIFCSDLVRLENVARDVVLDLLRDVVNDLVSA